MIVKKRRLRRRFNLPGSLLLLYNIVLKEYKKSFHEDSAGPSL